MVVSKRMAALVTVMLVAVVGATSMAGAADRDPGGDGTGKVSAASAGQVVQNLDSGVTPQDLAGALVGSGVTITNVTYTGANAATGRFSGLGVVGFDSGIVLSSGNASAVVGPNTADNTTTNFGGPGDSDLNALVAPNTTQDAAVLTIEFVPTGNQVAFDYVFGSEEYNEFVNSQFNDVFAFFVNGTNCATVNGDPVAVNTINGGNPFGTNATRPELYRNNSLNDPGPATLDTEMDGLTVGLQCSATVNPGVTNVLKLGIADTSDAILDSAVFLRAGSFTAGGEAPVPEAPAPVPEAVTAAPRFTG
jgi:hypothetical protein